MMKKNRKFLETTQEQGKNFYLRGINGEVYMLNMLKYRNIADYSDFPELAPNNPISGREAYQKYIEHTMPFLKEAGGELIFKGKGGNFLIGPETENWDEILIVKHKSVEVFMSFAQNKEFLKGYGHRIAALEDSRLLPLEI